ncbi:MAG TPA: MG2 domain-containing protein, partial [Abditibacterium sp.]
MKPFAIFAALALSFLSAPLFAVPSPRVITLSPPEGLPANGKVPIVVTGDELQNVGLRVWNLKAAGSALSAQNLVFSGQKLAKDGDATFYAPLKSAGLYLAEARVGAVTSSELFRLVPYQVAVKTISLSAPESLQPSKRVPFTVSASNFQIKTARLRLWKLGANGAQFPVWNQLAARKKVKKDEYDPNQISFGVPILKPGLYLAQADANNLKSLDYVRVSDLGVAVKRAPNEILVYAVKLSSGAPVANAPVRLDDFGQRGTDQKGREIWIRKPQAPRAMKTGADGVARFYKVPDDGEMSVVATSGDGSLQETNAPLAQNDGSAQKLLFYTERPIYRPGQKVFFKGIAREDLGIRGQRAGNSLYKPLVSRRVQVEITDAANRKIETLELKTNGMGTFAGELQLPDEAAVGRYSVETRLFEADAKSSAAFYNRFAVQEYRKPEYEVTLSPILPRGRSWATQGESFEVLVSAKYFFGGPVKGGKIRYSGDENGSGVLDERGEFKIRFNNNQEINFQQDRTRNLTVEITDEANRTVQAATSVFAPWSEVTPTLKFDRNVYDLQNTARVTATLRDPAGRGIAGAARLRLFYFRTKTVKNRETLRSETTTEEIEFYNQNLQTDVSGRAFTNVRLGKWGYIKATLTASDRLNRAKTGEARVWVIKPGQRDYYGFDFPALDVIADKTDVAPGETVKALFVTAEPGRYALVTLQSDRIFFHRVIKLTSQATPFSFVMPAAAAPGAHLTIGFARGGSFEAQSVYLRSIAPSQQLKIAISPEKSKYRPGETAKYQIKATDGNGRPRRAEISLGLVDKAIYGLANDETPDPIDFFYSQRVDRVATNWSQPQELDGGSYQRIEKPVTVRSRFEDTAYWNPRVQTGADGTATLQIPLPDNLTTWRATARGVTLDTATGASTNELLVTKPLLVRLITPRFWTQNDIIRVQVIVQNNASVPQNLRVSLRGESAQIQSTKPEVAGAQNGTVPANSSASFYFDVEAPVVPPGGKMSLTSTARGEGAGITFDDSTDAMKLDFPVKAHGVRVQKIDAGALVGTAKTASLDLGVPGAIANASRLEISLSPSLAGPMLAALPELSQFPYGCTEQTLSRFVPAVVAAKTLRDLKQPLPASMKELPKQVAAGLKILYDFQHSDGGWGWWREDDSDPYLTGAVLYGLSLTQEAGYPVERARIVQGLRAVQNLFGQSNRQQSGEITLIAPDTRAWMMLGYAS